MQKKIKTTKVFAEYFKPDGTTITDLYCKMIYTHKADGSIKDSFEYDKNGQVIMSSIVDEKQWSYKKNGTERKELFDEQKINDQREVIERNWIDFNGEKVKQVLNDNKLVQLISDKVVYSTEYFYDDRSRLTGWVDKDAEGKIVEKWTEVYVDDSNNHSEMILERDGQRMVSRSQYDQSGHLIKTVHYDENDEVEISEKFKYDNNGRNIVIIEEKNGSVYEKTYEYLDDSNLLKEETVIKKVENQIKGSYKKIFEYEFWED